MLEEDQAEFRIPMSLGEPHAELDASQCPPRTQDPSPLAPAFPGTPGSRAQGPPPAGAGNLDPPSRPDHILSLWHVASLLGLQHRLPGAVPVLPAWPAWHFSLPHSRAREGWAGASLAYLPAPVPGGLSPSSRFSPSPVSVSVAFLSPHPYVFNPHMPPEASWDQALGGGNLPNPEPAISVLWESFCPGGVSLPTLSSPERLPRGGDVGYKTRRNHRSSSGQDREEDSGQKGQRGPEAKKNKSTGLVSN